MRFLVLRTGRKCQISWKFRRDYEISYTGATRLIFIVGDPIAQVKSPQGVTPVLRNRGADVLVVPAQVPANALADFVATARQMGNVDGIIVTLPHKFAALALCDAVSPRAAAIGAVNLMRLTPSGGWYGDMQDGLGHVAALRQHGCEPAGQRALVIGAGGAGTAIAFALAEAGVCALAIHDTCTDRRDNLIRKLKAHCPVVPELGSSDPTGFDLVVNATPMGMNEGDAMPMEVSRIDACTFVGEVVMKTEMTAFLAAARARGCAVQVGSDMLYEQIPAYLEFFGFPSTTPDVLRSVAQLSY